MPVPTSSSTSSAIGSGSRRRSSRGWSRSIVELLERGYAPQLLLSQDVCHNRQLKAHGGFGYVYLHQHFLPTLRTAAVGEGEIKHDDDRQPGPHPHHPVARHVADASRATRSPT